MAYAHFLVPAEGGEVEKRFQKFLEAHSVLKVEQRFVERAEGIFWSYAVHYDAPEGKSPAIVAKRELGKDRIDYQEKLNEEDFALYIKLRDWRTGLSDAEGVPPFSIFHNATLAAIAEKRPSDEKALQEIPKVGEGKAKRYGDAVLEIVNPKEP